MAVNGGQVLALVGENGAGKSTLMNVLGGIHQPSSGEMHLNNEPYAPQNAEDAYNSGVAFIHQELNLFPNLSISENLFINSFPTTKRAGLTLIDRSSTNQKARELLTRVDLKVAPDTRVEDLSTAQQQLVEIAKAMAGKPRIIIFDEPTTALSRHESQALFQLIGDLRSQGIAMIYISHNLGDIMQLADNIAVLRDGTLVSAGPKDQYSMNRLIRDMVGRDLDSYFPARSKKASDQAVWEVRKLKSDRVTNISFKVNECEILGFYGLVGAGRSEMVRAILGLDPVLSGTVRWKDSTYHKFSPAQWIKNGVVYLAEDRREEGLLTGKSIQKNIQLASFPRYLNPLKLVKYAPLDQESKVYADITKINYQNLNRQQVQTLSGGNQQKVVLSRLLMTHPGMLILDEPTKGIDIGARQEIYGLINKLVDQGASAIIISSEIEELLGMCDRIIVMGQGQIYREFSKQEFDKNTILEAALGSGISNMDRGD